MNPFVSTASLAKGRVSAGRRRRAHGFTLIELMMALLVGAIVLTGVFAFSSIQQSTAGMQRRKIRVQHALEGAMWAMARDVRMAGFGFARQCTEVRIWVPDINGPLGGTGRLVNPGAADQGGSLATDVAVDPITGEPYWVLRDGIQAHWRSSANNNPNLVTTDISGGVDTSASQASAADSFDVMLAQRNMAKPSGLFRINDIDTSSGTTSKITVQPSALLTGTTGLNAIRQMFPPGSFVLLSKIPPTDQVGNFQPHLQSQCVILQITDDIVANSGAFEIPISNKSGFNANLDVLLGTTGNIRPDSSLGTAGIPATYTSPGQAPFDWGETVDQSKTSWMVAPMGQLRWSRYEIDYTAPSRPYLVRTDFISWVQGTDNAATFSADVDYPECSTGQNCPLPQLHLPGGAVAWENIPRVGIGPMIEDMQVAVGCDGFSVAGSQNVYNLGDEQMSQPDAGFAERLQPSGIAPVGLSSNLTVDEWLDTEDKGSDEWLGNAADEAWGPDCVYYGTGEYRRAEWATNGPALEQLDAPAFRMSPQSIRITLLAKPDSLAQSGNAFENGGPAASLYNNLFEIEDRATATPVAPQREYFTLTETFTPQNLRWRDSRL